MHKMFSKTVVVAVLIQMCQGSVEQCLKTGCDLNECHHLYGDLFKETDAEGCDFGLFNIETCCPPKFEKLNTFFQDCSWTGCTSEVKCSNSQIKVASSDCPAYQLTGTSNEGENELCCKSKDFSNVYGEFLDNNEDTPVRFDQLTLLGTHHSPTNNDGKLELISGIKSGLHCDDDFGADTQILSIADQFKSGVRAFDLRPQCLDDGSIVHYHGKSAPTNCLYDKIETILTRIASELNQHKKEVVLVLFQHFRNFEGNCYATLFGKIATILKNQVVTPADTINGWPKVSDMVKQNKRIVLASNQKRMYEQDSIHRIDSHNNIAKADVKSAMIGVYPNKSNAQDMVNYLNSEVDQMKRKRNSYNGKRFPLTTVHFYLTQTGLANPPKRLVKDANPRSKDIKNMLKKAQVNIVWVDFVHSYQGYLGTIAIFDQNEKMYSLKTKSPTKNPTKNPTKTPTKDPTNSPVEPTMGPTVTASSNTSSIENSASVQSQNTSKSLTTRQILLISVGSGLSVAVAVLSTFLYTQYFSSSKNTVMLKPDGRQKFASENPVFHPV